MNKNQLQEILELHKVWLESECKDGKRADLGEADLRWENLRGADLRRADLRRSDLRWADLRKACLREAYLWGANLAGADLSGVNLRGAKPIGAILSGVNLRGAILEGADLSGANLASVNGIYSVGPMPNSGRMVYFVKHDNCIMVLAGCFWGTTDELKQKANDENKPWYLSAIKTAKLVLAN